MTVVASYGGSGATAGRAIYAGFDFAKLGTFTLVFHDTADHTATFSTASSPSRFCHRDLTPVLGSGEYDDFATALAAAMTAASGTHTYTVTWDPDLLQYTIAVTPGVVNLTAGTNTLARNLLGFSTLPTAAGGSVTSDVRPYYVIATRFGPGASDVEDEYEPDGYAEDAESDDGDAYGLAYTTFPTYYDFTQRHETQAATYVRAATAAVPWTYQHLFRHARNIEPLLVSGSYDMVGKLRAEGARFKARRGSGQYANAFHVDFRMRVKGYL